MAKTERDIQYSVILIPFSQVAYMTIVKSKPAWEHYALISEEEMDESKEKRRLMDNYFSRAITFFNVCTQLEESYQLQNQILIEEDRQKAQLNKKKQKRQQKRQKKRLGDRLPPAESVQEPLSPPPPPSTSIQENDIDNNDVANNPNDIVNKTSIDSDISDNDNDDNDNNTFNSNEQSSQHFISEEKEEQVSSSRTLSLHVFYYYIL